MSSRQYLSPNQPFPSVISSAPEAPPVEQTDAIRQSEKESGEDPVELSVLDKAITKYLEEEPPTGEIYQRLLMSTCCRVLPRYAALIAQLEPGFSTDLLTITPDPESEIGAYRSCLKNVIVRESVRLLEFDLNGHPLVLALHYDSSRSFTTHNGRMTPEFQSLVFSGLPYMMGIYTPRLGKDDALSDLAGMIQAGLENCHSHTTLMTIRLPQPLDMSSNLTGWTITDMLIATSTSDSRLTLLMDVMTSLSALAEVVNYKPPFAFQGYLPASDTPLGRLVYVIAEQDNGLPDGAIEYSCRTLGYVSACLHAGTLTELYSGLLDGSWRFPKDLIFDESIFVEFKGSATGPKDIVTLRLPGWEVVFTKVTDDEILFQLLMLDPVDSFPAIYHSLSFNYTPADDNGQFRPQPNEAAHHGLFMLNGFIKDLQDLGEDMPHTDEAAAPPHIRGMPS